MDHKTHAWAGKVMGTVFGMQMVLFTWTSLNLGPPSTQSTTNATLISLKQWLRRGRKHKKNILPQHDNARPHTSWTTTEATEKLPLTILQHPPNSPDLVPYDFHLFPKMKEDLFGHLYDSSEEVERSIRTWMRQQSVEFFRDIFEILVCCCRKCVCVRVENGGELWRSNMGDKRAHFKNYMCASVSQISLLKQK